MAKKEKYEKWVYTGTVNGVKQKKHLTAKSQRELNKMVTALKNEVQKGNDVYTTAYFGDWADKWYREKKLTSNISASALTVIQGTIAHLNRYFEHEQLKNINLSMFQNMINELAENNPNTNKPMSNDLLKKIKSNAQSIFEYAAANNIAYVPMFFKAVTIPKKTVAQQQNNRRALTEVEQQYIIDTPHRAQLPAMIMLFSGLRRGECLALEWTDINLKDGYIDVNKSLEFGKNQSTIKQGGKTLSATRTVPIPPILVDYLINYKREQTVLSKTVCLNVSGKQYTKSSWDKAWQSYLLDINLKYGYPHDINKYNPTLKASDLPMKIEPFTPHYLRHTFATMLYLQDVDVTKAMQILGHTDIQTTVNIYTDFKSLKKNSLSDDYLLKLKTDYAVKIA